MLFGVVGCAKVLGKNPVPGRPASLDYSRARPIALAVGAGGGCLDFFFSSITSFFFPPLSGRRPDQTEILSQRAVKPKTTNQPTSMLLYYCFTSMVNI